jgi:hypothetical protein
MNNALKPKDAIESSTGGDVLRGTSAADTFFFDTAHGVALGQDAIKGFGMGDRIVTTSALPDPNNDGRISFNSSDRVALAGPDGAELGSLKVFGATNNAVSKLALIGTVDQGDAHYFVYGAVNDHIVGLDFLL